MPLHMYNQFREFRLFFLIIILSTSFNFSVFSNPQIRAENNDSLEVYTLCDSARNKLTNSEISLKFAHIAVQIAQSSMCNSCLAESEYTLGVVYYRNTMFDSSLYYFEKVLTNYGKLNSAERNIETIDYISYAYIGKYEYRESIKYAQLGLRYADSLGRKDKEATFYLSMGNSYAELGLYMKSIDAVMNSIKICEAEKDSTGISNSLISLGSIYTNNKNYSDAYEYTSRALNICIRLNDKRGISVCLNNIGIIYSLTSEHEKALGYYQRSMEIDKELGDNEGVAIGLNNVGDSYRYLHDTVLAVSYYKKCLKIGRPNNYTVVAVALSNLGEVYLAQRNYKLALSHVLESLELAESTGSTEQILLSFEILHKIYAETGNYEEAYNNLMKYKILYDTVFEITKSRYLKEVKAKYDDERQKTEISNLKDKSISESLYQDRLTWIIIIISLLIIVMLIINLLMRRSKKLVRNQILYYEKLLERSEDIIIVIDEKGSLKYISPSYERKMGRKISNRIGKNAFEFLHPDNVEYVTKEFEGLVVDKQPRSIDIKMKNGFDEWIDVHAYGQNLFDDPLINGIVINFWDITHRKRIEELINKNEIKFRQIFNAFPDIYFQADLNGLITEVSPSVTKMSGHTRDDILNLSFKNYDNFIKNWANIIAKFETEVSVHDYDIKVINKDGNVINCSLSAELIFTEDNSVPVAIQGVIHDISNRIKSQQRIRRSEIKLKEANKSKEKLFSIIAHDLIGPIGTNKSIVDLIVGQVDELSHEEIISLITSLKPTLDSTYSLIENLLSWARIQQHRLKPSRENILLNKLVEEVVELFNEQAQRKSIKLVISGDKAIMATADKNQLEIVLRNLLSNAIKFSNLDGIISISFDVIDRLIRVKISDSGIGMSQDQIESILTGKGVTEVMRGTNNERGTGFGLVIVNEFVKNNGGELSVESKVGEGTTFVFTLPLPA